MNNYKSKSGLYRIFVKVERTPITATPLYKFIFIPKLHLTLMLDEKTDQYKVPASYLTYTEAMIKEYFSKVAVLGRESAWIEVNNFKLEDNYLQILKSTDPLDVILASEMLKQKIEELNLIKKCNEK